MYQPGERIDVGELVELLGISRQPVMAALQQLSAEDIVQIIPQVGCVAAVHSPEEWADFRRFFASGEALMAQLATERALAEELKVLRALSKEVAQLPSKGGGTSIERAREYRRRNQHFHEQIYRMARSPVIARRVASLWDQVDYYISTTGHSRAFTDRVPTAIDEHEKICDAIERRNAAEARRLMEGHILEQLSVL
jgi:DNA-binding GntR family transcriptional regulator